MDNTINYNQIEWKSICDRGIINYGNLIRFQKVLKKAMQGKPIGIGFIGGSITAGSLASTSNSCYAYLVYSWFKDKFPMSKVNYINAGIGDTTSRLGVARAKEDLLLHSPDVVFVEFSVNDNNDDRYMETYEGLIRNILLHTSNPAVILINSVAYDSGINAQEIHNIIGKHYYLPIVSMKESIFVEIEKGRLDAKMITPDYLHPNDLGHRMLADVIINLLDMMHYKALNDINKESKYELPDKPITRNRYISSVLWNNKNIKPILKGFITDEAIKEGLWDVFKYGWYGISEGSSIRFNLECKNLAILYRKYAKKEGDEDGCFAPIARLVLDNYEEEAITLDSHFDEDWGDSLYVHEVINDPLSLEHSIEVTITNEVKDKKFYIAAIITI
ncbi:MAG: SGNH/GDSL hydrolase family protein [Herbinix sp.]|nr:SGNH/GDSL hydrolase family protein [Herbinix sp.]